MNEVYVGLRSGEVTLSWTEVNGEWLLTETMGHFSNSRLVEESEVPEYVKKAILIMKGE